MGKKRFEFFFFFFNYLFSIFLLCFRLLQTNPPERRVVIVQSTNSIASDILLETVKKLLFEDFKVSNCEIVLKNEKLNHKIITIDPCTFGITIGINVFGSTSTTNFFGCRLWSF